MTEFTGSQLTCMVLCALGSVTLIVLGVAAALSERAVARIKAKASGAPSDLDVDELCRTDITAEWGDRRG